MIWEAIETLHGVSNRANLAVAEAPDNRPEAGSLAIHQQESAYEFYGNKQADDNGQNHHANANDNLPGGNIGRAKPRNQRYRGGKGENGKEDYNRTVGERDD